MPTYVYECIECQRQVDIFHSMSEINNLSDKTNNEINSCLKKECSCNEEDELKIRRVPQAPMYTKFDSKTSNEKAAYFKKRSDDHFQKETKEVKRNMLKEAGLRE